MPGTPALIRPSRTVGSIVLAIFVALISATHLLQGVTGVRGDPRALVVEHWIAGVLGLIAAWGIWMGKRWTPWILGATGIVVAALIVSLGPLLDMQPVERRGLWTGAATILLATAFAVWYLTRRARRPMSS